jgi:hypothetical protein
LADGVRGRRFLRVNALQAHLARLSEKALAVTAIMFAEANTGLHLPQQFANIAFYLTPSETLALCQPVGAGIKIDRLA